MTTDPSAPLPRPGMAGLLALLSRGLGHIYAGRRQRAYTIIAADGLLGTGILVATWVTWSAWPLAIGMPVVLAWTMGIIVDAVRSARSARLAGQPRTTGAWPYVAFLVTLLVVGTVVGEVVRGNLIQAFRIPSESMEPTLRVGDYLLVDRTAYRDQGPERGDVLVFQSPLAEVPFIFRCVAIGGDTVRMVADTLIVNGTRSYGAPAKYEGVAGRMTAMRSWPPTGQPYVVPAEHFLVLGDNRHNAADSRFHPRHGIEPAVANGRAMGRARLIYFSIDPSRLAVRFERLGMRIE